MWEQSRTPVILNYAALSLAVVVILLGAQRIAGGSDEVRAEMRPHLVCQGCRASAKDGPCLRHRGSASRWQ